MQPQPAKYSTGGTVQASGGIYITRPADDELFQLCLSGTYAHVLTSRQMGKSSLRVAVSDRLRVEGIRIASIDLTSIGTNFATADQWYVSFLETVEHDLRLKTPALDWWESHNHLTPATRFTRYLLDVAVTEIPTPTRIVIFVDEIDSTLSLPFQSDDFFAAIRSLFNSRSESPAARRLSFVLIGSVAPGDLIRDATRTPFNIGRAVTLTDFTEESAQPLTDSLTSTSEEGRRLLRRIFQWTSGHPYLTQRLCVEADASLRSGEPVDMDAIVRRTFLTPGDSKDSNLEWTRDMLTERAPDREAVLTAWRDVIHNRRVQDEEASVAKSHLKLSGVARAEAGRLISRNRTYATAFDDAWTLRHLPQDLIRQRRLTRYRRVALIALGFALTLAGAGLIMGDLLLRARRAEADATAAKLTATRERDKSRTSAIQANAERQRAEVALQEANYQRYTAEQETKFATSAAGEAKARQLAAQAEYQRTKLGQLSLSSLLGVESIRRLEVMENRSVVASALELAGRESARLEHRSAVGLVTISPDNRWFATADSDATVRIWDPNTGRERARLEHQDNVWEMTCSPDGKWLTIAGKGKTVRVWDIAANRERALLEHQGSVYAVRFTPDGKRLATASGDKTARVWDTATWRELARLEHKGAIYAAAISPDGKWLVTCADDTAYIWDFANGAQRARFENQTWVNNVAISPDGKWLVTAGGNTAHILDVATGRERSTLQHENQVNAVAISPDGKWLATASKDNVARIWNSANGAERSRLQHQGDVLALAVSPDGEWLATASADHTARIWEAETGHERARLEHAALVNDVAISPDGKWLVTASDDKTARIWDASAGRSRSRLEQPNAVDLMLVSPDGNWIATGNSEDDTVHIWDPRTGRENRHLENRGNIADFSFARKAPCLITLSSKGAQVWDVPSRRELAHAEYKTEISAAQLNPDCKWFATATEHTVHIWDVGTGRQLKHLEHPGKVSSVDISPDGKWLVTASADNFARIWNVATGDQQSVVRQRTNIDQVEFAPGGRWLLTFDEKQHSLSIWDVAAIHQNTPLRSFEHMKEAGVAADGKWLAIRNDDNAVRIIDLQTGRERMHLEPQLALKSLDITPDGKWLAASSSDNSAHIWDLTTGQEYIRLLFDDAPNLLFVGNTRILAVAHGNSVTLEPWQTEDLVHDLCSRLNRNLTLAEWRQYIGNEPYRRTCPNLPDPPGLKGPAAK